MSKFSNLLERHKIIVLAQELVLFALVFCLGIYLALNIKHAAPAGEIAIAQISLVEILVYFLLATLLILFLLKAKHGRKFLNIFFILALFSGLQIVFNFWLNIFWATILAILFLIVKHYYSRVWLHNLIMILVLAGIGSVFGISISPWTAALILIVLSIYDVVAVFGTKHMVAMARGLMEQGIIIALIIPEKISDWQEDFKKIKPSEKFVIMGGGDFAMSLILIVSVVNYNWPNALVVAIFALLGVLITHWFFVHTRKRRPIPALPPIAFMGILGFIFSFFIF